MELDILGNDVTFETYRKRMIKAAVELTYSKQVIEKLKQATSVNELTFIMETARKSTLE